MPMPLEGLKVLDLSRQAPGPYCTMLLADMGADVLRIEEAGTPAGRRAGPASSDSPRGETTAEERRTAAYDALGRNKRSLRLNLKTADAREIFYRLADQSDVVLEGFRPGVVQRLGVDDATLRARNPRLIHCSLSGFGQTGPYAQRVGHDLNFISIGGALGMIGSHGGGGRPALPSNILADFAGGGLMAAFSIVCAVQARERTGEGQSIDLAMSDGVLSLLTFVAADHFRTGSDLTPRTHRYNGASPEYNVYETKDGRWFSVAALEAWFFANLCHVMGSDDLIGHENTADEAKRREIHDVLTAQFKTKTADEWFRILNQVDICATPVLTVPEALANPHNLARGTVVEVDAPGVGPVKQVGIAPKFSATPGQVRHTAPWRGQDTDAVLAGIGLRRGRHCPLPRAGNRRLTAGPGASRPAGCAGRTRRSGARSPAPA